MAKRSEIASETVLEVSTRGLLVSQIMQHQGGHPITEIQTSGIGRRRCETAEVMGKCQRPTIIARIHVMRPQTAERAQLIFSIAESSGNYQGLLQAAAVSDTAPVV